MYVAGSMTCVDVLYGSDTQMGMVLWPVVQHLIHFAHSLFCM